MSSRVLTLVLGAACTLAGCRGGTDHPEDPAEGGAVDGSGDAGPADQPTQLDGEISDGPSETSTAADKPPTVDTTACIDPPPPRRPVDCSHGSGNCAALTITGDPKFVGPGSFHGYADPGLVRDPLFANRVWLGYSWLHLVAGTASGGGAVTMAAVENHLARSDDGGLTFTFVKNLWPAVKAADPEGSGENGIFPSETASLLSIQSGSTVTWYGTHLRYFLRPMTGYNPKYATSWLVLVGAAPSPDQLTAAPEAILGVSTTASVYKPHVRLDVLAGVPIQHCALVVDPTLFSQKGTLYLIVECKAFIGTTLDHKNSTIRVFATTPAGAPSTWTWRHAGVLADHALAVQLGSETIQQPDVSLGADGTPLLVVTPAHTDVNVPVGTVGDGCVAIELESIDPPKLKRDCAGRAVVRASLIGTHVKACSHDPRSATGIMAVTEQPKGGDFNLRRSLVRP